MAILPQAEWATPRDRPLGAVLMPRPLAKVGYSIGGQYSPTSSLCHHASAPDFVNRY
jgi:hypothetical protein